jgi:Flp pilus assembly protein TadD
MTLTLNLPDHLAAPREAQPVDPSDWGASTDRLELPPAGAGGTPSFLLHARTAADEHHESAIAWARRAQAAQAASEPEEAIESARRALTLGIAQGAASAVHAAVIVLAAHDEHSSLRALLDDPRALELPALIRARAAFESGDADAALDVLGERAEPGALALRAWLSLERNDFQAAISYIRHAQKQGAGGPAMLVNLGYAHAALGNVRKAIRVTRQAAALAPHDRAIGFNLAGFYRSVGDIESALTALDRLQTEDRLDFELALAKADVLVEAHRSDEALQLLRAVRTSQEWALADDVSRSELTANLAFLRWMMNREETQPALKAILRALGDCGHASVQIAYMLPNLLRAPADAPILEEVLEALEARHPADELHGLRMHVSMLTRDSGGAVEQALAWAHADTLNPCATAVAVHLLSDLAGRFEAAADLGRHAIARNPVNAWLVNNVAYAYALAGRTGEAERLIDRLEDRATGNVMLTATRALAALLAGDLERGLDGYRHAYRIAQERDDRPLALLVGLNLALTANRLPDPARDLAFAAVPQLDIPIELTHRLDFWIVGQRLQRELGFSLDGNESPYWRVT